jgi:hypothetical protein
MKAGESAPVELPVGMLPLSFKGSQTNCSLGLVVAMLEADANSANQMQAGYQAYLDELRSQVLVNLNTLTNGTEDERDAVISLIKTAVKEKVFRAVFDTMSWGERIFLDKDDFVEAPFRLFSNVETLTSPVPFTIRLVAADEHKGAVYEIDGILTVTRLQDEVDPCQAELDAFADAQEDLEGLKAQLKVLKQQLQTAPPQQKADIIKEIERITQGIPRAEAASAEAEQRLFRCRLRR